MPYEIKQSSSGYCVHKQGGSLVPGGCHKSKSKAMRHMRALYANEPSATKEGLIEASKEHTGVMVALPVPQMYRPFIVALQSLLPRNSELVPPEQLHLTLIYLGDASQLESLKTQVFAGALNAAEWQTGIVGTLTGLARFNNDESGKNALVILVDSPRLPDFRHNVLSNVKQRVDSGEQRHGFIPHITLGYIPVDAKTPQIAVPPIPIVFDSYVIAWADEHLVVPLSGVVIKAEGKGYGARAGETIRGNLVRGGDGKFASAGSGSSESAEEGPSKPTQRRQRLGRTAARNEAAKRQQREAKRQATANERERKRQERLSASARRKQEVAARREAAKRAKQQAEERQRAENRKAVMEATGIKEDALKALEQFAAGGELEFDSELADVLVAAGLVVPTGPGNESYKMGSSGRALLTAIKDGDIRQAKDALANGREAVAKRRAARARQLERESRREKSISLKHGSHDQSAHGRRYSSSRKSIRAGARAAAETEAAQMEKEGAWSDPRNAWWAGASKEQWVESHSRHLYREAIAQRQITRMIASDLSHNDRTLLQHVASSSGSSDPFRNATYSQRYDGQAIGFIRNHLVSRGLATENNVTRDGGIVQYSLTGEGRRLLGAIAQQ